MWRPATRQSVSSFAVPGCQRLPMSMWLGSFARNSRSTSE